MTVTARARRLGHAEQKRVLITGGAGFIGSHLAEALVERGNHVTALDNMSTGTAGNVSHLHAEHRFELREGDIADQRLMDALVARHDVVFHLAAAVGVSLILADPIESFRTNVLGTETVLHAAAKSGSKVLIASTSEVYGKVARLPQREDDDVLLGPTSYSRWSYAASKMLDEFLGLAHARRGLPVVCFRLFNTVGPRQTGRYGMVVPRFVDSALRGEPLHVHGDGLQSRCFLHVKDAVDALIRLERTARAIGHVFNIGSTESVTILDLAHRVISMVGSKAASPAVISLVPYDQAYPDGGFEDIPARQPEIAKIRSYTRWRPKLGLEDILRDVIAAHEAAYATSVSEELLVPAIA